MIYCFEAHGRYKVGYTSRDEAWRRAMFQSHCPFPVSLIFWFEGGRAGEQAIHKLLEPHVLHGEWYSEAAKPIIERLRDDEGFRRRSMGNGVTVNLKGRRPRANGSCETRRVDCSDEQWRRWKRASATVGMSVDRWIADVLDRAAGPAE